ncbi:MAG: hypothetical protein HY088_04015 [Ignavibacteriales bacterium]|nr:hypothetical protein [Ignavibacteriales bacterium]
MELKTKTFLFIILSFLLGAVAGGFIGRTYFAGPETGSRPSRAEFRKQFAKDLKLTPGQEVQVDSILEFNRDKISVIQKQFVDIYKLHKDTLRLEIRKLLTPEQNKLYDERIRKQEEREAKKREAEKKD